MSSTLVTVVLWAAALSSGLMAGIYFAFSAFIMKAFSSIETAQSVTAMNAINESILRSSFMPFFFGSTIVSALLIVVAILNWGDTGAEMALIAGMIYFVGMFVCTIVFNVPLNNSLAAEDPYSDRANQVWIHYLDTWTRGNHLRTVCSLITCMLSIWLLTSY